MKKSIILTGLFLLIFLAIFSIGVSSLYKTYVVKNSFKTTQGILLEKSLESSFSGGGETGPQRIYKPKVKYRYDVNGVEFIGSHFSVSDISISNCAAVMNKLRGYQANKPCVVHYNPIKPEESYLYSDYEMGPVLFTVTPVMLFIGLLIYVISWQRHQAGVRTPILMNIVMSISWMAFLFLFAFVLYHLIKG